MSLVQLADSLATHGGTPSEVAAVRGLASLLMGTGRVSTVTIDVDGKPGEYLATAQEIVLGGCPATMVCTMQLNAPIRSVIAFEKSFPRRAVQLFTADFSGESWAPPGSGGTMTYIDGTGAMYAGKSTSHTIAVARSDKPCVLPDTSIVAVNVTKECTQAEFNVSFDGTLALLTVTGFPDSLASPSTASTAAALASHRVRMTSQAIHGVHRTLAGICIDACQAPNPPGLTPPMPVPTFDTLAATLTASVGSDVALTFTVKNTRSNTLTIRFNDAQQYDFRVWNDKGVQLWHWAADKGFAQMLTSRTLAPGESVSWTEHFTPPAPGSYRAMAYLTSSSHFAVAFTSFSAP